MPPNYSSEPHIDRQSVVSDLRRFPVGPSAKYERRYFASSSTRYYGASTASDSITPFEFAESGLARHMQMSDCRKVLTR
jgi:hypothetical protein